MLISDILIKAFQHTLSLFCHIHSYNTLYNQHFIYECPPQVFVTIQQANQSLSKIACDRTERPDAGELQPTRKSAGSTGV